MKREWTKWRYSMSGRWIAPQAGKALAAIGLAEIEELTSKPISERALRAGRRYWQHTPASNSLMFEFQQWQRLSPREQSDTLDKWRDLC